MKTLGGIIGGRLALLRQTISSIGLVDALTLRFAEDWNRVVGQFGLRWNISEVQIRPKGYSGSVVMRVGSSDFRVFEQIFVWQQYMPLTTIRNPEVIVDCGANAGYSALFFLKHFPLARVIAAEPDALNAELCRRNLRSYGNRAVVVEKAIWGRSAKLEFVEETQKPGKEWGIQVHAAEASQHAKTVEAVDIPTLMEMTGVKHIDLLKIDIEESEANVFQSDPQAWLSRVRNIAIELHGPACSEIFHSALSSYSFTEMESGDVTVCLGMRPRTDRSYSPEGRDERNERVQATELSGPRPSLAS